MYVAIVILFVIPSSILWFAWRGFVNGRVQSAHSDWRSHVELAGLYLATVAVLATMLFLLSWTHSGGSPHGGQPPPGLWLFLRPAAMFSVIATVGVGLFGRGRTRLLVLAVATSIFCVTYLFAALEMD